MPTSPWKLIELSTVAPPCEFWIGRLACGAEGTIVSSNALIPAPSLIPERRPPKPPPLTPGADVPPPGRVPAIWGRRQAPPFFQPKRSDPAGHSPPVAPASASQSADPVAIRDEFGKPSALLTRNDIAPEQWVRPAGTEGEDDMSQ